jgi:nitroimidazol reductase NimA-like FMN-containing flavoprotein (pyridoxamine 5'-phosphate oxidase superfamily)
MRTTEGRTREPAVEEGQLVELSRDECLTLLRGAQVGRIAVPDPPGAPDVVPVNYVIDGEAVVFRSGLGTKFRLLSRAAATFQVDDVDLVKGRGWSVMVKGRANECSHWETGHLRVEPMAAGPRNQWMRLVPAFITGRRIGVLIDTTDEDEQPLA